MRRATDLRCRAANRQKRSASMTKQRNEPMNVLGTADKFIAAVKEHNATILGMSALLTTTMTYMKTVIDEMREAELGHVKICIGGAPVNQDFADEIGADGYAPDAANAVELFKSLVPKPGETAPVA